MFVLEPERVVVGFLKAFFSQSELYHGIKNEFQYSDNVEMNKLNIVMSETFNDELENAVPALIVTEGGFSENTQMMDNRVHNSYRTFHQAHRATFFHPITIHCLGRQKGTAKILQAATAQAFLYFRKAIYELGVDHISPINGMPPQRLSSGQEKIPGPYDCAIQFNIKMDQVWLLESDGDIEEKVRFKILAALDKIEYDENGNIVTPQSLWFEQKVSILKESENA